MITLDGTSGYLASAALAAYNLPQALTVSFWANLPALPGSSRYVLSQSKDTARANFRACGISATNNAPNTGFFWQFFRNSLSTATPFGNLWQPGSWQHVVAWCDGASEEVFVNGKRNGGPTVGVGAPQAFNTTSVLNIGADVSTFFQGSLAEFGLWTAALNPDEIVRLASGAPATAIRPEALLVYLPLDQIEPSHAVPAVAFPSSGGVTIGPTPATLVRRGPLLGARL